MRRGSSGSNIGNILVIIAIVVIVRPIAVDVGTIGRDDGLAIAASVLSRLEGVAMLGA